MFNVSDIKQFLYCPRIIYFTYVMPVDKKSTFKMESGKETHLWVSDMEERRKLKIYGLDEGERRFRLKLHSERLKLSGILDMLIITHDGYYPVEFKDSTSQPSASHKYQLTAYAMLVEDKFKKPVRRGFIHLIPKKKTYLIDITQNMRDFVKKMVSRIDGMIGGEKMPDPSRNRGKCVDCEFRNWCGDV